MHDFVKLGKQLLRHVAFRRALCGVKVPLELRKVGYM